MKYAEKIDSIFKTSKLAKMEYGRSKDLESFWQNFIEPHLPPEEAVVGWDKILMNYIHDDNTIFSLRIFGNYINKIMIRVLVLDIDAMLQRHFENSFLNFLLIFSN